MDFFRPTKGDFAMATIHATQTMHATVRPAARIVNAVSNFMRAWKNRREFYRLGEMSDTELADIGLTRSDLTVAVDLSFGTDPTVHLGALADARQREIETMARQVA
jgi:uncharacterized protein YjiS (DUF1127 family)